MFLQEKQRGGDKQPRAQGQLIDLQLLRNDLFQLLQGWGQEPWAEGSALH